MTDNYKNKILIVEDNPINSKLAVSMLERLGLEVQTAPNGQAAIDSLSKNPLPDLILMDLQMPTMDGIEATNYLQQHLDVCPVIIAMTANIGPEYKAECLEAGMTDFIEKPIRLSILKEVLPHHLPTLRLSQQHAYWEEDHRDVDEYQKIDVAKIENDYSECWDIFYQLYRDFVFFYQEKLPLIERHIKHQDSLEIQRTAKEFLGLSAYFHSYELPALIDKLNKLAVANDFKACLQSFRLARKEAQSMIREVSLLLSNETQKMSQ